MDHVSDFTSDLNTISGLSDSPNITDGLSASSLKAKFDYAGNTIQSFIRTSLISAVNALIDLSHSHTNKTVLDNVTADVVSNSHAHENKTLLDTYTQTEADLASAVSVKHTHANKSVLDGIATGNLMMAGSHQTFSGAKTFSDGIVDGWDLNVGGQFVGNPTYMYGTLLPAAGTVGRIYFKKV